MEKNKGAVVYMGMKREGRGAHKTEQTPEDHTKSMREGEDDKNIDPPEAGDWRTSVAVGQCRPRRRFSAPTGTPPAPRPTQPPGPVETITLMNDTENDPSRLLVKGIVVVVSGWGGWIPSPGLREVLTMRTLESMTVSAVGSVFDSHNQGDNPDAVMRLWLDNAAMPLMPDGKTHPSRLRSLRLEGFALQDHQCDALAEGLSGLSGLYRIELRGIVVAVTAVSTLPLASACALLGAGHRRRRALRGLARSLASRTSLIELVLTDATTTTGETVDDGDWGMQAAATLQGLWEGLELEARMRPSLWPHLESVEFTCPAGLPPCLQHSVLCRYQTVWKHLLSLSCDHDHHHHRRSSVIQYLCFRFTDINHRVSQWMPQLQPPPIPVTLLPSRPVVTLHILLEWQSPSFEMWVRHKVEHQAGSSAVAVLADLCRFLAPAVHLEIHGRIRVRPDPTQQTVAPAVCGTPGVLNPGIRNHTHELVRTVVDVAHQQPHPPWPHNLILTLAHDDTARSLYSTVVDVLGDDRTNWPTVHIIN